MSKRNIDFVFSFDKIFNETRLEPGDYLKNVPKKGALYQLILWLNNDHFITGDRNMNSPLQMQVLLSLLQTCDLQSYKRTILECNNPNEKHVRFIWLLPHTSLSLIEFILNEYYQDIFKNGFLDIEGQLKEFTQLTDRDRYELLKAYFAIERARGEKVKLNENMSFDEVVIRNFTERIGTYELERGDDVLIYFAEFLKSIDFFSFLENEFPNELKKFIETRKVSSWESYVIEVTGFFSTFRYSQDNYQLRTKVIENSIIHYFDAFVNHESYKQIKPNFRNLKEYPLLKYNESSYLMISRTFLFEKIYKALFFEFQKIAGKDIKSDIGKKFFEEKLSNKYISKIFSIDKIVNIPGNDERFLKIGGGEPDHYIRTWNNVFIFESKDTLITDEAKTSMNNEFVIKEIEKKLVWKANDGKRKPAGVSQLANFIKNFETIYRLFDQNAQLKKITVYPILILQDRVLSTMGINHILNEYFQKELTKEIRTKLDVKPLVVMNIDCLILYSSFFAGQPTSFINCIKDYIKFFKKSINEEDFLFSFDIWMRRRYFLNNSRDLNLFEKYLQEIESTKCSQFKSGDLSAFRNA
jgi:hypothetical protein